MAGTAVGMVKPILLASRLILTRSKLFMLLHGSITVRVMLVLLHRMAAASHSLHGNRNCQGIAAE